MTSPVDLPPQDPGTPWPTRDWPEGALPGSADRGRIAGMLDHAFAEPAPADIGVTHALLIVRQGRLVVERYAEGFGPDVTCHFLVDGQEHHPRSRRPHRR